MGAMVAQLVRVHVPGEGHERTKNAQHATRDDAHVHVLHEGREWRNELVALLRRELTPMIAEGGARHIGEIEVGYSDRTQLFLPIGRRELPVSGCRRRLIDYALN